MGDVGETYRAMKLRSQQRRASHRKNAPILLKQKKIPFEVKNGGAHLVVEGPVKYIDFWPGTGKWYCRSGKKGFGIRKLIQYVIGGSND